MKRQKTILGLVLIFGLLWGLPGRAPAQTPQLETFLWTSQMQAHLLRGIISVYSDVIINLKGVNKDFTSQLKAFDQSAGELKKVLDSNGPDHENTTKYLAKLLTRKRTLEKTGTRIMEARKKGRKIKKDDIAPLEKAAFQAIYEARQLMRNLLRGMEKNNLDQENRQRISQILLLAEMQGHLLNSIREAFADNLRCNSSPADSFWLSLSSFDILAAVYQAEMAGAQPDQEKSKALRDLLSLKHDVLLEGEALYLVAKTCKPDIEAAKSVEIAAGQLMPLFQTLIRKTLK